MTQQEAPVNQPFMYGDRELVAITAPNPTCKECRFLDKPISHCNQFRCSASEREDGRHVIFVTMDKFYAYRLKGKL